MTFRNRKLAGLAIAALGVAACGGSSSGNGSGTTSAFARGSIERFGSVVVNGVEWRTQGATLLTPDDSVTRDTLESESEISGKLREGQVVSVKGKLDDDGKGGQASEIEFHRSVEGVVSSRDAAGFTVGGVKVSVDSSTEVYSGSGAGADDSYTSVSLGDRVSVSGVPDDKGGLRAGAVKIEDSTSTEIEVKGYVLAAPSGGTFSLALTPGGPAFMIVNGSGAVGGLAAATAGAFVEVKGASVTAGTPPTLTATLVKAEDDLNGDVNDEAEVEGIVSSGTLASFVVAGTTVTTSATTTYTGIPAGSSAAAEFAIGSKVEAEGTIDASGKLAAKKVKFKDGARMGGAPTAITAAGFTLLGNQAVVVDGSTQVEGTVATGTFVEVRGYRRADGSTYAQRVKVSSGGGGGERPFLQGVVESAASPSLTINGIAIQTNASTEFQDDTVAESEVLISQSAFFALVKPGSIVKVKWPAASSLVTDPVKEAELESEDD